MASNDSVAGSPEELPPKGHAPASSSSPDGNSKGPKLPSRKGQTTPPFQQLVLDGQPIADDILPPMDYDNFQQLLNLLIRSWQVMTVLQVLQRNCRSKDMPQLSVQAQLEIPRVPKLPSSSE
ncbi:hypothetical protein NDU88_002884 [Pleurodeles waltl]|uniref:Uncharacterized protein n=1 Tax=Pleurodeles waltl TaxID=8319 RepID=A0AAV7W1W0_PLEWA|nr:hypothetical protein NDU88_002884 [Pleurodeles waltl]